MNIIIICIVIGVLCPCGYSKKALREERTTTEKTIYLDLEGGGGKLFQDCASKIKEKGHDELDQIKECLHESEAPEEVKHKARNIVRSVTSIAKEVIKLDARRNSKTLFRFRGGQDTNQDDENFNRDIEISKTCTAALLDDHPNLKAMMFSVLDCVKRVGSYDNIKDPMPNSSGHKNKKKSSKKSDCESSISSDSESC